MDKGRILRQKASKTTPFTLVDLPLFQGNYNKVYWAEPGQSASAATRHTLVMISWAAGFRVSLTAP